MSIAITNIAKTFGSYAALKDISLEIRTGELIALLGPSGSGKTTLLRIIAGLEEPDGGRVSVNGEDITKRSVRERDIGFVFQHYALFRHMTVFENIAFGLEVRPRKLRLSRRKIRDKVVELLTLVQMDRLADRYPSQLSGGQRQRVALARALAVEPKVLLLDEPFGSLDAKVRRELRRWLLKLHKEVQVTTIFVTHDQEEALEVSDRVVIMSQGRIEQIGTPEEVYDQPANSFVYHFLGSVNPFHGRIQAGCARVDGTDIEMPTHAGEENIPLVAYARPHDIEIHRIDRNGHGIEAVISRVYPAGPIVYLELNRRDTGQIIEAEIPRGRYRELGVQEGEHVSFIPRNLRIFAENI
jgi:sulfate transport system ATP-binding protein